DWGRYASCYRGIDGRPGLNDVVSTPALDRLAREGVLFPSSRRGGCRTTFRNMRPGCSPRGTTSPGRERHVDVARDNNLPYPMRAIRTATHLYIRNLAPDRLPLGRPGSAAAGAAADAQVLERDTFAAYPDMDAGPTKAWLIRHRDEPEWRWLVDYAVAPRPAEELYDLRSDPDQVRNVAESPEHAVIRRDLAARLDRELQEAGDPRLTAEPEFERPPFTDVEERKRP
ncbi:MAG: sulfatase, partial [Planctomycetota bacterium]